MTASPKMDDDGLTVEQIYLCRASGEGSHDFRLCEDEASVFVFYDDMFGKDSEGKLDNAVEHFRDMDNWSNGDTAYECELYCAKFEVWIVEKCDLALSALESRSEVLYTKTDVEAACEVVLAGFRSKPMLDKMVDRFLAWPLPFSVCADLVATRQSEGRIGTNLLSATEARQMLEYVLSSRAEPGAPERVAQEARRHSIEPASAAPESAAPQVQGEGGDCRPMPDPGAVTGTLSSESPVTAAAPDVQEEWIRKVFAIFGITDYPMNRKIMRELIQSAALAKREGGGN